MYSSWYKTGKSIKNILKYFILSFVNKICCLNFISKYLDLQI